MIEANRMTLGGNSFYIWTGDFFKYFFGYLSDLGERLSLKGNATIITNPTAKFINHCTLLLTFTVNGTDKYQTILESSDYKTKYKEVGDSDNAGLTEEEMFLCIAQNTRKWYLKN